MTVKRKEPLEANERAGRQQDGRDLRVRASQESIDLAKEVASTSHLRVDTPVRRSFVRDAQGTGSAPLAQLVATRGRGNAVAIKLYLALIWRCAAAPFETTIPPRKWAALLSLDDPDRAGAQRISDALKTLQRARLITLTAHPGLPSTITLLEESGTGREYELPSTAYVLSSGKDKDRHLYFKIPTRLWTRGFMQVLSAPALAVLLAVLSSEESPGKPVWWSTSTYATQFALSPASRARGTKQLTDLGLLKVSKMLVGESHHSSRRFTGEKVRNVYRLAGAAGPPPKIKKRPTRARRLATPPNTKK